MFWLRKTSVIAIRSSSTTTASHRTVLPRFQSLSVTCLSLYLPFRCNNLAKDPVAIRCPVAGVFHFQQQGDIQFQTRILGGVTDSPRPEIHCMHSVSSLQVCDSGQREMVIDAEYCLSTDTYGRPVDIYSTTSLLMFPSSPLLNFLPLSVLMTIALFQAEPAEDIDESTEN